MPVSGGSGDTGHSSPDPGADNVAIVRRVFEAFSSRDVEGMIALLDPEVLFEPVPTFARPHKSYLGHEGMRQYFGDVSQTWERLDVNIQEYRAAGSYVIAFGRIYASGGGSVADDPASFVWRLENGKVVWGKVFRRRGEALDVVGLSE
jgi:ketosteroid isomerase-like protein